jgi:hypothetical protein
MVPYPMLIVKVLPILIDPYLIIKCIAIHLASIISDIIKL